MKKFFLLSAIVLAALVFAHSAEAQGYVPFNFYGFMTKEDVSYNTPKAQQYVVAKLVYTPDSENPYYLQRQTSVFDSKVNIDNEWVKVSSCYMREGVMYVVRYDKNLNLNQISTYDASGNETIVTKVPTSYGYITHAAYVETEDMVYMVLSSPVSANAALYKAPATDPAELTFVASICSTFMEKPFSFTYSVEKDLFFYVTNSAKLYSLTRSGEKDYYYEIHPDQAYLPSDGSNGTDLRYIDSGSGLIWAEPYNMLIWTCPRGATAGASLTYWYGLELVKNSETPVVHRLINHTSSGLSSNCFNCMITQGIAVAKGVPPAPTYVSVYPVSGKPGYYDLTWASVRNDVDGNPIEGEISFNVYIGNHLIAQKVQPARGTSIGTRILLPHAYTEDVFYVGVQTVTEAGESGLKEEGPVRSSWDPENPGGWLDDQHEGAIEVNGVDSSDLNVAVNGNNVIVTGLNGKQARIFAIDGKIIASIAEDSTLPLPAGLYIVKTDRKALKITVK